MEVILAAVLICLLPLSEQTYPVVPIQYVTVADINSGPRQTNIFGLKTCGGTQFEHFTANVFVNFPDKKWNPFVGDYVKVNVVDIHGHVVSTNVDGSGKYIPDFHFLYHKEYQDLTLHVTGGNAPLFKYTITVTFNNTHQHQGNHQNNSKTIAQNRYIQSTEEVLAWEKITASHTEGTVQDLVTVFKTSVNEVVDTADVIGLTLQYCFNPDSFPGNVTISILATDEVSGFATYVCTADIQCNSVEDARFFDVSGASVNFVTVLLDNAKMAGPIEVLVRGDGRYGGKNTFNLAASRYRKRG